MRAHVYTRISHIHWKVTCSLWRKGIRVRDTCARRWSFRARKTNVCGSWFFFFFMRTGAKVFYNVDERYTRVYSLRVKRIQRILHFAHPLCARIERSDAARHWTSVVSFSFRGHTIVLKAGEKMFYLSRCAEFTQTSDTMWKRDPVWQPVRANYCFISTQRRRRHIFVMYIHTYEIEKEKVYRST